jgi:uncharacterized HhH-GPD family protein
MLTLPVGDEANELLNRDPLALVLAMVLDQQIPMEKAFAGPRVIADRMGGELDAQRIAAMDEEAFAAVMAGPPAVHRFPASMGARVQALCRALLDEYDGDAAAVWAGAADAADLLRRLRALPGFGEGKAQIFLALLAKQRGVRLQGWREAAEPYGEDGVFRSVADVTDAASLATVRDTKRAAKRALKGERAG